MGNDNLIIPDNKNSKEYQKPELVDLNEIKETLATCSPGSGDTDTCTAGGLAVTPATAGPVAHNGCTDGGLVGVSP